MSYRVGAVALGSNLGDREKQLMRAVRKLERTEGVIVLRRSDWIESAPVGGPAGQGLYLNGVMLIETELEALALLEVLHRIEAQLGREREAENERNMPRTIDLDLLFLGDLVL
ncbi:MAG: 2-amino-4-hydroxy-6-hydroxymethyldihydropteridine diphosphokinase, partial [Planctomycetota bacterium]